MPWVQSVGRAGLVRYASCVFAALVVACSPEQKPAEADDRTDFATQYAAAWSGKDPVRFGEMYEENGSLIVNGSASTGRAVNLRGYERWTFGPNGLLLTSDGFFDDAEYQRQLKGEQELEGTRD